MNTQNSESKGSLASTERKQEKRKLPPRSGMKTSGSAVKTSTSKITPISNGMFFAGNLMTEKQQPKVITQKKSISTERKMQPSGQNFIKDNIKGVSSQSSDSLQNQ